ncbi:MAG: hypothetical protein I3J02_11875 [Prevotella sp.]|nr:hypothetical protein [Prevotella sp.]
MKKNIALFILFCLCSFQVYGQAKETIAVFGDSYSTFEGYLTPDSMETWYFKTLDAKRTDVCEVRQTWWWQVVSRGGYKLGINDSWSGSTICNTGYNDQDATYKSFLTRVDALGSPDIILIFGGTNDAWAQVPLGEFKYDHIRFAEKYCFRPALAFLLQELQDRYPNVRLYFISNCDLNKDYTSSIQTICSHYAVPVIQLHDIDKQNGHPTVAGMKSIADQVLAAMAKHQK